MDLGSTAPVLLSVVLSLAAARVQDGSTAQPASASQDAPGWADAARSFPEHGRQRNVAVLVFDGVELLDFSGPVEVFSQVGGFDMPLRVYTVAASTEPIRTNNFVRVVPDFSVAGCPPPDILVIPGGEVRCLEGDRPLARFVREQVPRVEIAFSVCNGAFALASAGFLDGLQATTFHSSIGWLREAAPNTVVRDDLRVVDNGHIVTAAGVSAGIDGALHLVDRLFGPANARRAASRMEYEWREAPPEPDPPPDSLDRVERARQAWYGGKWAAALDDYRALAAARPDDGVATARLGTCLLFTRHVPEALESLERAAALAAPDATAAWVHHALGIALGRSGRHADAVAALARAQQLDPDALEIAHALGNEQCDAGMYREAEANLTRCWRFGRGDFSTISRIARARAALEDVNGALAALEEAEDEDGAKFGALLAEPAFDALRGHPRFGVMVERATPTAGSNAAK